MIVTTAPDTVTLGSVASIVSMTVSSLVFLMTIFLVATAVTVSENVSTMLAFTPTSMALSAGDDDDNVGAVTSAVVKFNTVLSVIPV